MKKSLLFPLLTRIYAAEVVTAAYLGILGRPPDEEGLRAHSRELGWRGAKTPKSLEGLLATMAGSQERWQRSIEQRADELARAAFRAVLRREPLEQELSEPAAQLRNGGNLAGLIGRLTASDEHWEQLLEERSHELVLTLYRTLFDRDPDSGALKGYVEQLEASRDLTVLLTELGRTREFWQEQVAHRAGELVSEAYRSLLGREPEDAALKAYAEQLKEHKSLEQTLAAIAQSQEHRDLVRRDSAEEVVRSAFAALLQREPEEAALTAYAANIRQGQPLTEVLSSIAHSQEHWRLLVREHAEEVVTAAFHGLLGREPDSVGLAAHAGQLRLSNDLTKVISTIGNSRERTLNLKNEADWPHPRRSYDEATWVFMHIEKTGGTSLQNMLLESFGAGHIYNEHHDSLHLHSPAELSTYTVFAGHFNHDSLAFIPRRRLNLFTFVREPMQRLLSLYHFWRSHVPSAPHFNESMRLAHELPIEAYFTNGDLARSQAIWNHMTWCVMGEQQWRVWRRVLASARGEKRTRLIATLRAPIRERLREFCFIGLQEKFTQSCRELYRIIGRTCPAVRADHSVEQLSGMTSYITRSEKPELTPRAIEVMTELVELDAIVYEEAKTLYDARLARGRNGSRARRTGAAAARATLKSPATRTARG